LQELSRHKTSQQEEEARPVQVAQVGEVSGKEIYTLFARPSEGLGAVA
jgi:hypothetical protein